MRMNFEWEAQEHTSGKKSAEWYLAAGVIVVALVVTSVIFDNILLAIIVGFGFIALIVAYNKPPTTIRATISHQGVRVHDKLYLFDSLDSYFIDTDRDRIVFKPNKLLSQHLFIPLSADVDTEALDDFLADYLDEEELRESVFEQFVEYLGF